MTSAARLPSQITRLLGELTAPVDPGRALRLLVQAGYDPLPLPGGGATLARWQALAAVAAVDLSLVKLVEGHTDALAILAELNAADLAAPGSIWGVWCAEPPDFRVSLHGGAEGGNPHTLDPYTTACLRGVKAWCSGAATVSHALVSAWDEAGRPCLAAVSMDQPGVTVTEDGWQAVGMRASASVNVVFNNAVCVPVGAPGAYVGRPGFQHGGAGVAACWYGALTRIAAAVQAATPAQSADPHRLAHLGAIDVALDQARAVLRETAAAIDANPHDACSLACGRARLAVEAAATEVITRAGRALGAGPLCRDAGFAQVMADLPVFIRQSHAERDQAALGHIVRTEQTPWQL
ncbi:acyl-CoA dehydrogenase [Achromobacter spanius]|uniref:acyl-CoA dehydrogenase n=1 Tax=Achromobacter spanius TaxID=217203 RepID=UPI001CB9CEEF|nr:acyl-CoA dehydrogenase [Achromobacter spanius]